MFNLKFKGPTWDINKDLTLERRYVYFQLDKATKNKELLYFYLLTINIYIYTKSGHIGAPRLYSSPEGGSGFVVLPPMTSQLVEKKM